MFIQLTTAGLSLLQSGPFVLDGAKFGDAYNYVPDPLQADIQGNEVWSSSPGPAYPVHANVVRYSIIADRSVGDFDFGEIGFYVGSTLVAIGVNSTLIKKTKTQTGVDGNFIRIDAFLSMVGTTYEMWLNLGDTDNKYVVSSVDLVDYLPPVHDTIANAFIVGAPTSDMLAFFAYSDRSGLWAFDQYKYSTIIGHRYQIVDASPMQVTINGADKVEELDPASLGTRILQFTTGALYSTCRNIQQAIENLSNDTCVLVFNTPLAIVPAVGDEFVVYNRDPLASTTINIPIATRNDPGIVKIGNGIDVQLDGLISVDRTTVNGGLVYSIKGKDTDGNPVLYQGDVELNIRDIVGGIRSVNSQLPDADGNVNINTSYVLPIASDTSLGGVMVASGSGIDISADGHISVSSDLRNAVQSVNGNAPDQTGNVTIYGLIDPQVIDGTFNADAVRYPGLYQITTSALAGSINLPSFQSGVKRASLEVIPLDPASPESILVQRWVQEDNQAWRFFSNGVYGGWFNPATASQIIATTTTLGSVVVGVGLNVTPTGIISTAITKVAGQEPDSSGNVNLDALDVNAIPYPEKGEPGGVATLTSDPNAGLDPASKYVHGRVPLDQLSLEALTFRGYYDALLNKWSYVDDAGFVHFVSLRDLGQMEDSYNNGTSQVTVQLPGLGVVLYTSVEGDTEVDGVSHWNVGDLVIGISGRWIRVVSVPPVAEYDLHLGISIPNVVAPASVLFYQVFPDNVSTSNVKHHAAKCRTPPIEEVQFSILLDDNEVGTVTFAAGSETGIVNFPGAVSIATTSIITITSPNDLHGLYGLAIYLTFTME